MTSEHRFPFWVLFFVLFVTACQPSPILFDSPVTSGQAGALVVPTPTDPTAAVPPPAVAALAITPSPTPSPSVTPSPTPGPSLEAATYLNDALNILQEHSVQQNKVDWQAIRINAYLRANNARVPADTYNAIRYAVDKLGDHHSRFYTPQQVAALKNLKVEDNKPPEAKMLDAHLAYLFMPAFVTFDDAQRHLYANQLQALIDKTEAARPCGWVLDLRQNLGGNIWPMFVGIGPLLGDGTLGAFVYPDGEKQIWRYTRGQVFIDDTLMEQVDGAPQAVSNTATPVAILTGSNTQSAGEAVVIAFRGRPNARSFGQPTGGLSTANATYDLKDGAEIVLTVVIDADRTGKVYGDSVPPDQVVKDTGSGDATLDAAEGWLMTQPACKIKN